MSSCFARGPTTASGDTPRWLKRPRLCGDADCDKKPLAFLSDHEAAAMLARISDRPTDASRRDTLAAHYELEGYAAAAAFYRSGAKLLRGSVQNDIAPKSRYQWTCASDTPETYKLEDETAALLNSGRYALAVDKAFNNVNQNPTCGTLLAWSEAVVVKREAHLAVDPLDRELALRILLTSGEQDIFGGRAGSLPELYLSLADSFVFERDAVSSYVAVKEADILLSSESPRSGHLNDTRAIRLLRQHIANLESILATHFVDQMKAAGVRE
jgi:hypothetical protein